MSTPGSVPGDPISAELRWSIREVISYAGAQEITQANGLSPRGLRQAANRCNNGIRLQNIINGCGLGAVEAGARHLVIGSTPRMTRCFAAKGVYGDTVSGVTLLVIQHARKPFGCEGMRTVLAAAEEDRAHDTKERERPRHDRCTVTVGHRRLRAFDRSQDRR